MENNGIDKFVPGVAHANAVKGLAELEKCHNAYGIYGCDGFEDIMQLSNAFMGYTSRRPNSLDDGGILPCLPYDLKFFNIESFINYCDILSQHGKTKIRVIFYNFRDMPEHNSIYVEDLFHGNIKVPVQSYWLVLPNREEEESDSEGYDYVWDKVAAYTHPVDYQTLIDGVISKW